MHPAKTQISLDIRPVWPESSLCAQRVAKYPSFLLEDSEDSDQTGRMPRLIWVFAGRTAILLVLSCVDLFNIKLCKLGKLNIYHSCILSNLTIARSRGTFVEKIILRKSTYAKVHDPHTTCLKCFPWCYYTITRQAIPMLDLININDYAKFHQNIASSLPCQ